MRRKRCLWSIVARTSHFFEKTYISNCFCQRKEIWRGYSLLQKKAKEVKIVFSTCFTVSCYRGSTTPWAVRVVPPSPFLGNCTQQLSIKSPELWTMSERKHLCFISIYVLHVLARCVLKYQKSLRKVIFDIWECSKNFLYRLMAIASLFYAILGYKSFHRNALLLGGWGHLYILGTMLNTFQMLFY